MPVLDVQGFELHSHTTACTDFYDDALVKQIYYSESAATLQTFTGALAVFAFDHNVRSAVRAERGESGIRLPVDAAHVDYTAETGPQRTRELLERFGRTDLAVNRAALINLWRPITSPVIDVPLALCDVRTVHPDDLVDTAILHYVEDSMDRPGHAGRIYSLRHSPAHRWAYVSEMHNEEILLLKCYDSRDGGNGGFMPHTGFRNPACPPTYIPRESIEVRMLAIYPEKM